MVHHRMEYDEAITQINVVPLVDIMLVLLIIFMLTASFISTPSVPVQLPKAITSNPTAPASRDLVLNLKGEIYFGGKRMDRDQLSRALREAASLNPDMRLILSADASVTHGKVVELLDLVRQAGITRVALGVVKP